MFSLSHGGVYLVTALLCLSISLDAGTTRFRSEKVNYIYDKAIQHITDRQRLGKLETELSSYDSLYMNTKEQHASGKVSSLNKELAKIDEKLLKLLERYDLQQTVQAFREKIKNRNEYQTVDEDKTRHDAIIEEVFKDERLEKLWQIAKTSTFSKAQLAELHSELKEVENKHATYDNMLEELQKVPEESNSIDHNEPALLSDKKKELKEAHRAANEHYEQLHEKITKSDKSPFENDKVKKLWKMAEKHGNFTAHDLDVIKEELTHFDKQIKKIAFHKEELLSAREELDKSGKSVLDHVDNTELEAKHERMGRKLKKLEKYLETKIRHSEL